MKLSLIKETNSCIVPTVYEQDSSDYGLDSNGQWLMNGEGPLFPISQHNSNLNAQVAELSV